MTSFPPLTIAIGLAGASGGQGVRDADAMIARARVLPPCEAADDRAGGEVVVCGRRDGTDRYRLPLPVERVSTTAPVGVGSAAEILATPGDCGPSGTRRCSRREALSQGLGGGRDPATLLGRLAGVLPAASTEPCRGGGSARPRPSVTSGTPPIAAVPNRRARRRGDSCW